MKLYILFTLWLIASISNAQIQISEKNLSHLSGVSNGTTDGRALDRWSFSGTQMWEPRYLAFAGKRVKYLPDDWREIIVIPEPPANSSIRTKAELHYLATLISKRPNAKSEIEAEVSNLNLKWGEHTFQNLTKNKKYLQTSKLILETYDELAIVCFTFKKRFNRVRPSILAEKMGLKLGTVVQVPNHPAYPSGHSIGAYTLAYILQELDPENAEKFWKDAIRIAHNREIGGLHYPSDSEAGRQVARQIVDSLLENEKYQFLLDLARAEWK